MKIIIIKITGIALCLLILLSSAGCDGSESPDKDDGDESSIAGTAEDESEADVATDVETDADTYDVDPEDIDRSGFPSISDIINNSAWAVSDTENNRPGSNLAITSFASKDSVVELDLAFSKNQRVDISYTGIKEQTKSAGTDADYYLSYAHIRGHTFNINSGDFNDTQYFVTKKELVEDSRRALTAAVADNDYEDEMTRSGNWEEYDGFYNNHGHPEASASDVAIIEELYRGRKVRHSELLATASDGATIGMYQFENVDYGMFIVAYINGSKVVRSEYISGLYDGDAGWRADAPRNDVCYIEPVFLCETKEGVAIAYLWYGPEGLSEYFMIEKDGFFEDVNNSRYFYGIFHDENDYMESDFEEIPVSRKEVNASDLIGKWENEDQEWSISTYTFNNDGNGTYIFESINYLGEHDDPITCNLTYKLDGNKIIYTTVWPNGNVNNDVSYISIENGRLSFGYETFRMG